jgi:hypothetical protein
LSVAPEFKDGVPNRVDILAQFSYETSHGVNRRMNKSQADALVATLRRFAASGSLHRL